MTMYNFNDRTESTISSMSSTSFKTLDDIKLFGSHLIKNYPDGVEVNYTNHYEKKLFAEGKLTPETTWKYSINRYGFRDTWDLTECNTTKIGFFGDSYTYGEGLQTHEIFISNIQSLLGCRAYNVGLGGSSLERITRTFSVFTKFVDIDIAIVTLPSIYRELYVDDNGVIHNVSPDWVIPDLRANIAKLFLGLPDTYQFCKLSLNVNYILDIAAERNIKVLFASWDQLTQRMLTIHSPNNTQKNPFITNGDKTARDRMHPGRIPHYNYATQTIKELTDREWI
jgi:hypothetical protein